MDWKTWHDTLPETHKAFLVSVLMCLIAGASLLWLGYRLYQVGH